MNPRSTWVWLVVASALLAFIWFFERERRTDAPAPPPILPAESLKALIGVVVRPAHQPEIRAEATNGLWRLTEPLDYPAQPAAIEGLLQALARLKPDSYLDAGELRSRPNASEEYGLVDPQFSVTVLLRDSRRQLLFGVRTAPGDQVFLQVVGTEGVYVVTSEVLKLLPLTANQWRDRALVNLQDVVFDRINLTNGPTVIELQTDPASRTWRMTRPLPARADGARITELLMALAGMRVAEFVTDDPKADREQLGLHPAELTISLARGTNPVMTAHFGKSPTNSSDLLYACREQQPASIVLVSREQVAPWRGLPNEFRDHQLLTIPPAVARIDFQAETNFSIQRTGSNTWKAASETFPLDAGLVNDVLSILNGMKIVEYKDVVTQPDLPAYGLASPARLITLQTNATGGMTTNGGSLQLAFGLTQDDKTFVRRSDENAVYAVPAVDVLQLPTAAWQLRERQLWNFAETDAARVIIRQGDRSRQLVREGTNSWSLAPGSEGIIDAGGVELAIAEFGQLAANFWVARAPLDLAAYGFGPDKSSLTFELKSGRQFSLDFGGRSPTGYAYAATTLDGELWVFESPAALSHLAQAYLSLPPNAR